MGRWLGWMAELWRRWYRWLRTPWRPYTPDGWAAQPTGFLRTYGGLERCYSAVVSADGWLVVRVHHRDGVVRAHLERHRLAPAQFLHNLEAYAASGTPAALAGPGGGRPQELFRSGAGPLRISVTAPSLR